MNLRPSGINSASLAKMLVREGCVLWSLPGCNRETHRLLEQLGGRHGHHQGGRKPEQDERTTLALDTLCLTHEGTGSMDPEPVGLGTEGQRG